MKVKNVQKIVVSIRLWPWEKEAFTSFARAWDKTLGRFLAIAAWKCIGREDQAQIELEKRGDETND